MLQVFSKRTDKPTVYPFLKPVQIGNGNTNRYLAYEPIEFSISDDTQKWRSYYDVPDLSGIYCYQAPDVQPATQTDNLRKIAIQDGQRLVSSSYEQRTFTMNLIIQDAVDDNDAMLAFDAIQRFLVGRSPYWICFSNWPQRMYYVKAKLAKPTFTGRSWTCEVTFTDLIGLSRSVTTSLHLKDYGVGFGNNIPLTDVQYSFNNTSFTVYNPSDVLIDPDRRGHPFVMTLQGSSSGNMKITNKTTGDVIKRRGILTYTINGDKSNPSDFNGTWVVNGVRITLNDKSDNMKCDSGTITLAKGNNQFQIENFSGQVSFDFPCWWLS